MSSIGTKFLSRPRRLDSRKAPRVESNVVERMEQVMRPLYLQYHQHPLHQILWLCLQRHRPLTVDQRLLHRLLCKICNVHPRPKTLHRSQLHRSHLHRSKPRLPHNNWLGQCQLSPWVRRLLSSPPHQIPSNSSSNEQVITVRDPIRRMHLESLIILHPHNRRCITWCTLQTDKLVQVYGLGRMGIDGTWMMEHRKPDVCLYCSIPSFVFYYVLFSCWHVFLWHRFLVFVTMSTSRTIPRPPPSPLRSASASSVNPQLPNRSNLVPPGSSNPPQKTKARDLLRKHYGLGVGPPPPRPGNPSDPMDLSL